MEKPDSSQLHDAITATGLVERKRLQALPNAPSQPAARHQALGNGQPAAPNPQGERPSSPRPVARAPAGLARAPLPPLIRAQPAANNGSMHDDNIHASPGVGNHTAGLVRATDPHTNTRQGPPDGEAGPRQPGVASTPLTAAVEGTGLAGAHPVGQHTGTVAVEGNPVGHARQPAHTSSPTRVGNTASSARTGVSEQNGRAEQASSKRRASGRKATPPQALPPVGAAQRAISDTSETSKRFRKTGKVEQHALPPAQASARSSASSSADVSESPSKRRASGRKAAPPPPATANVRSDMPAPYQVVGQAAAHDKKRRQRPRPRGAWAAFLEWVGALKQSRKAA